MAFVRIKDFYFLLVAGLIKGISWSPSPKAKGFIVRCIALAAYHRSRGKRRLIEANLSEALDGEFGEYERREIVKRIFSSFWEETFSLLPTGQERAELKRSELTGTTTR